MSTSDWPEIYDVLHRDAQARRQESEDLSRRIRAQLLAEHSKFMEDFTDAELRIFGMMSK